MYEVLPFTGNYFWPSAVRGRQTNGNIHSATIRLMTNHRREIWNVDEFLDQLDSAELEQETMTGHELVTSPEGFLSEDGSEVEVQLL